MWPFNKKVAEKKKVYCSSCRWSDDGFMCTMGKPRTERNKYSGRIIKTNPLVVRGNEDGECPHYKMIPLPPVFYG